MPIYVISVEDVDLLDNTAYVPISPDKARRNNIEIDSKIYRIVVGNSSGRLFALNCKYYYGQERYIKMNTKLCDYIKAEGGRVEVINVNVNPYVDIVNSRLIGFNRLGAADLVKKMLNPTPAIGTIKFKILSQTDDFDEELVLRAVKDQTMNFVIHEPNEYWINITHAQRKLYVEKLNSGDVSDGSSSGYNNSSDYNIEEASSAEDDPPELFKGNSDKDSVFTFAPPQKIPPPVLIIPPAFNKSTKRHRMDLPNDMEDLKYIVVEFQSLGKLITEDTKFEIVHNNPNNHHHKNNSKNNIFPEVGGLDKQIRSILYQVRPRHPKAKPIKGLLLYGPPGTGKTTIARLIAQRLSDVPPIMASGTSFKTKWLGETEKAIRDLFAPAKNNPDKLHVIIVDELDSIALCRDKSTNDASKSCVNELLTNLDGLDIIPNILFIGITNRKDDIDPALLRPGRLGSHFCIDLPDFNGRKEILRIYTKDLSLEEKDIEYLARISKGASGAIIKESVNQAYINAAIRNELEETEVVTITVDNIKDELRKILPKEDRNITASLYV